MSEIPRYIAHFHADAKQAGDVTDVEWDCTDYLLELDKGFWPTIADLCDNPKPWVTSEIFMLRDPAAPDWVRSWSGPFTITVRRQEANVMEHTMDAKKFKDITGTDPVNDDLFQ